MDIARAAAAARGDLSGAALARVILDEAEALADDVRSRPRARSCFRAGQPASCTQDVAINRSIGQHGARLIPHGANLIHHCNTGALATVDYGTALGIIYGATSPAPWQLELIVRPPSARPPLPRSECHAQGKGIHVWVDETRPRLQGARLTAWELMQAGASTACGVLAWSQPRAVAERRACRLPPQACPCTSSRTARRACCCERARWTPSSSAPTEWPPTVTW